MAGDRLNHLDWLRYLMIVLVVYAHTDRSFGFLSSAAASSWVVDDHELPGGASALGVRWISVARQWCLPLLFYISGAAAALAWKGRRPNVLKLTAFALIGMLLNAGLWLLSPRDPECSPQPPRPCSGQGILFDFTIVYQSGVVFPIVFQMWYIMMLILFEILNWPLFSCVRETTSTPALPLLISLQWLVTVVLPSFLSGSASVFVILAVCEALVFALVDRWFLRIIDVWEPLAKYSHYAVALLAIVEFSAPFASQIDSISVAFVAYAFVGFNKFYVLGFLIASARREDDHRGFSRIWPLALLPLILLAPSTNWLLAGNLTFPFFPCLLDRALYIGGSFMVVMSMDRVGREWPCEALPHVLGTSGLVLYLTHPVVLTICAWGGVYATGSAWLACVVAAHIAASIPSVIASYRGSQSRQKADGPLLG